MRRRRVTAALGAAVLVALLGAPAAAVATPGAPTPTPTPSAPAPTSTAGSPEAPDPAAPAGGDGPAGVVPGGARLAGRGVVVPDGAAALPPAVTARAWALVDLGRGTVLAASDAHGRYQPASILKTLAALVLLPRLAGPTPVPISEQAAGTEGSAVGLAPGGAYTADTLFTAMLLMSGNDATEALVEAAGGDAAVVAAMTDRVHELGGVDTVVEKPTGLDGWSQLTSAYDMALVLRAAVADPRLLAYDAVRRAFLPAQAVLKNGQPVGTIEMDNQSGAFLDTVPGAVFVKTGFTDAARHTFLGAATRDGRTLGVVLLRAERVPVDQWQQASALLDWGFARPADDAGVGSLDDAATLARKATATTSAPGRTATATPSGGAPAAAGASRTATARGAPLGPLGYAGVAGVFLLALVGVVRRRRRRR